MEQEASVNVFGEPLESCSEKPLAGFYRDGCCNTGEQDIGMHTVCVQVTKEFLEFSRSQGNDLSTPRPEMNFPGLNNGDRWCLCATRWLEAHQHGKAPKVYLMKTHKRSLDIIPMKLLQQYAVDLN